MCSSSRNAGIILGRARNPYWLVIFYVGAYILVVVMVKCRFLLWLLYLICHQSADLGLAAVIVLGNNFGQWCVTELYVAMVPVGPHQRILLLAHYYRDLLLHICNLYTRKCTHPSYRVSLFIPNLILILIQIYQVILNHAIGYALCSSSSWRVHLLSLKLFHLILEVPTPEMVEFAIVPLRPSAFVMPVRL